MSTIEPDEALPWKRQVRGTSPIELQRLRDRFLGIVDDNQDRWRTAREQRNLERDTETSDAALRAARQTVYRLFNPDLLNAPSNILIELLGWLASERKRFEELVPLLKFFDAERIVRPMQDVLNKTRKRLVLVRWIRWLTPLVVVALAVLAAGVTDQRSGSVVIGVTAGVAVLTWLSESILSNVERTLLRAALVEPIVFRLILEREELPSTR